MNDKIIINIISETYSTMVSLLIFIFLLLFTFFIVLQNGFIIKEASLSNVTIKELYIKWDEKINVSLKEIKVSHSDNNSSLNIDFSQMNNYLKSLVLTKDWFESISVENIIMDDMNASFYFSNDSNGYVHLTSKDINLNAIISLGKETINFTIKELKNLEKKLNITGNMYFSTATLKLYTQIDINVSNEADLKLYAIAGTKDAYYKITSEKNITSFAHIISLLNLSPVIKYWAYDAINMSSIEITNASGYINYTHVEDAYKNVNVVLNIHNLNYIYNKDLDAIHTKYTQLEFTNGVLFIRPKEAYTYGVFLGTSALNLDFKVSGVPLTLDLIFKGRLNKDVLKILSTYEIDLPFLQHSGSIDTNLELEILLRDLSVNAKGDFYTKKANFDYLGLSIDIFDAHIKLNNHDVQINNMKAAYQDIAKAVVDLRYNAKLKKGTVNFNTNFIHLGDLSLDQNQSLLNVVYKISPESDTINVANSQWKYKDHVLNVDAIEIPFDLQKKVLKLNPTLCTVPRLGKAFASGSVDLSNLSAKINLDVLNFSYDGISLSQSNTPLHIEYIDNTFLLKANNDIYFDVAGTSYKVNNLFLQMKDDFMYLKHTNLSIGKYITTKIYAKFDMHSNQGHFSLNNFSLINPNTKQIMYKKNKILISANLDDEIIKLNSKELGAKFTSKESGWKLKINSLSRVSIHSPFLKIYKIQKGNFTLYKKSHENFTRFKSNINYPSKILVRDNIPISQYKIQGKIYKEKIYLDLNNNINIVIQDEIHIEMNNVAVDIFALLDTINSINKETAKNTADINVIINAKDSYIYISDKRKILYKKIDIQYYNKILTAQLRYKKGKANLMLEGDTFHIHGKNFNDVFMNKLFSLSKFYGGNLDFSFSGKLSDYKGVFYINKTLIKDYKALNNILAFINTVPSLMTFNIPGYAKDGLPVEKAYVNFHSKNNLFTTSDIYLTSPEITILGKGEVDMNTKIVDLTLNLKTDLGSNLSRVPIVGFILLNQDTVSTTLSVKGDLSDPTIKSMIAQEIIVAPINIIKRTFSLPYNLIKDKINKSQSKKATK